MGWKILAVFLLVGANAFFVAAEFGLVAVRGTRIEELRKKGSRRATSAQKALDDLNLMLSGCQLGITFASLGLGWVGEPLIAHGIERLFVPLPPPFDAFATHTVAVILSFAVITFLHVVLGELVPKNAAIAAPEPVALWVATPMRLFTYAFRPLIWLFNETANIVLRGFKIEPTPHLSTLHTPEELAIIVQESARAGTLALGQSEILTRTLEFRGKRAVEAMVPRVEAQGVKVDAKLDDLLQLSEKTGYSRFPVWNERPDEFVGVVHLKDMLKKGRESSAATVKDAMHDALLVPESLPLEGVLIQMRRERKHFAIVLDEFGSTAGILTLEDIIEELVGEIRDEYDVRERDLKKIDGGVRIPGTMRPDELADATGLVIPEGEYETVAGFILEKLGRVARRGDEVPVNDYRLRVANVRQRRIISVDVRRADG